MADYVKTYLATQAACEVQYKGAKVKMYLDALGRRAATVHKAIDRRAVMDTVAADHGHVPWLKFSSFAKTVLMSRGEDGGAVHKTETQQHNGVRDRLKALLNMFTEVYALDEVPDLEDVFFNKSDKGKTRGIFTEAKVEFDNKNLFGKMQRCSAHLELSGRGAMCWNRS